METATQQTVLVACTDRLVDAIQQLTEEIVELRKEVAGIRTTLGERNAIQAIDNNEHRIVCERAHDLYELRA